MRQWEGTGNGESRRQAGPTHTQTMQHPHCRSVAPATHSASAPPPRLSCSACICWVWPREQGHRCDTRQVLSHSGLLCHICNTELTPPLQPPRAAVRTQGTLCFSSDVTQGRVRPHPHPQEQLLEKGAPSCLITSAGTPCWPLLLPLSSPWPQRCDPCSILPPSEPVSGGPWSFFLLFVPQNDGVHVSLPCILFLGKYIPSSSLCYSSCSTKFQSSCLEPLPLPKSTHTPNSLLWGPHPNSILNVPPPTPSQVFLTQS